VGEEESPIPTALDRFIQQAILQVLFPIFDPHFSDSSYGFRPKRGSHDAVKAARVHVGAGYRYVVDIDLEKFFDRVNHDVLMARVARRVRDKVLLRLIGRYLTSGVMVGGVFQIQEEGTPQGGPLSPLLSNILLDDLDKDLERERGIEKERAFTSANNGRGPWWNAGASHMNAAIPVKWLSQQGLLSLLQEHRRLLNLT